VKEKNDTCRKMEFKGFFSGRSSMVLNNGTIKPPVKFALGLFLYCLIAAVIVLIMYSLQANLSAWTSFDVDCFHRMAETIIHGTGLMSLI
jgi:dipeptide/tripeptide permease